MITRNAYKLLKKASAGFDNNGYRAMPVTKEDNKLYPPRYKEPVNQNTETQEPDKENPDNKVYDGTLPKNKQVGRRPMAGLLGKYPRLNRASAMNPNKC